MFASRLAMASVGKSDVVAACGSGEMANTLALGASAERLAGSSPAFRTRHSAKAINLCGTIPDGRVDLNALPSRDSHSGFAMGVPKGAIN